VYYNGKSRQTCWPPAKPRFTVQLRVAAAIPIGLCRQAERSGVALRLGIDSALVADLASAIEPIVFVRFTQQRLRDEVSRFSHIREACAQATDAVVLKGDRLAICTDGEPITDLFHCPQEQHIRVDI
jgi:hypothetical protein